MKRVLVTGGAGAIGGNMTKTLLSRGCEVTVLDDLSSGYLTNLPDHPGLVFVRGNVADDEVLEQVFKHSFDVVFHLAALFANQNSVEHPEADLRTNGSGMLKMLRWCHRMKVGRFVFTSSSCVYGAREGALSEDAPRGVHQTPYAMTKAMGEDYLQFYHRQHSLPTVCLRYFNSYGPGEYPGRYRNVIPNFLARAIAGEPLVITGSGSETRDFTFVDDVVRATIASGEADGALGEEINIGTGRETTILELAELINSMTKNPGGIRHESPRSWDHVLRRRASIDKARRILAYEPTVTLEDGLRITGEWIRSLGQTANSDYYRRSM